MYEISVRVLYNKIPDAFRLIEEVLYRTKLEDYKRLKEILAKCNGDLVWRYVIEYGKSDDTDRSVVASFQQCAGDGSCFPKQAFEYQSNN
jgi:hypothetical protein